METSSLKSLSLRVSQVLEGECVADIVTVCAMIATFVLATNKSLDEAERREDLDNLVEFMREQFDGLLETHRAKRKH